MNNTFPRIHVYGSILKPPSHIHEQRHDRIHHADETLVAAMMLDREYIDACRAEVRHDE